MSSPRLREWHWPIALCVTAFAAAIAWVLVDPSYHFALLLSLPILLMATDALIAIVAAAVIALFAALVAAGFAHVGDFLFVAGGIGGVLCAIRGHLFVPMESNPIARFVRTRVAVASLCNVCVFILLLDSAFKTSPWLANAVLILGYVALGRYLRAGAVPETPRSIRPMIGNAALFVFGILFAAGILEVGARYLLDITQPPPPSLDVIQADDGSLWALRPTVSREYPGLKVDDGERSRFTVTHSSAGLRGPELGPKREDELRIALLGDSFTYGWGVNDDETIAARLQQLAEATESRPVSVLNLGVAGYSPWQQFERLKRWGMPLKPDLVVLQLFPANDIPDTIMKHNQTLPAFGHEVIQQVLYWRDHTRWDLRLERTLRSSCAVYNAYRDLLPHNDSAARVLERLRFFEPPRDLFSPDLQSDRTWWMEVLLKDWYPLLDQARSEFEADVLEIVEYCRKNRLPIVIYAVPWGRFDETDWQTSVDLSRTNSGEEVEYEQFKDAQVAEEFFRANELFWIPVLERMRQLPDPDSLYIEGDGHFNVQGCKFIATLIFNRLVQDGHLAGPEAQWPIAAPSAGAR